MTEQIKLKMVWFEKSPQNALCLRWVRMNGCYVETDIGVKRWRRWAAHIQMNVNANVWIFSHCHSIMKWLLSSDLERMCSLNFSPHTRSQYSAACTTRNREKSERVSKKSNTNKIENERNECDWPEWWEKIPNCRSIDDEYTSIVCTFAAITYHHQAVELTTIIR